MFVPSVPSSLASDSASGPFVFVMGRSLGGAGIDAAMSLARANPEIKVITFECSWSVVDEDRTAIAAARLESRVAARHVDAWLWALSPDRRAA